MFDPWLSECAKYNAVISITVKLPGNRSNMCHTEWRGSESTKQTIHVYKEEQTDPPNEEVGTENKPTTCECYRITAKTKHV